MIFLGAGASKYFGLDTLQDMTKDLVDKMAREGNAKIINDIIAACSRFGLRPDFENIYTALEGLSDPIEGIKTSGSFGAYVASKMNLDTARKPELQNLLKEFRKLVYDKCTIKKGIIEERGGIFDRLFKTVAEFQEERFISSKTGNTETRIVSVGNTIVTTNYDVAVQLHCRHVKKEFAYGFKATNDDYVRQLDLKDYGRYPTSLWLIKLHGSIWQFKTREGIFHTIDRPESSALTISVGEQMMIYPVGEKPILKEPYYSFYSIFKEQPWNTMIAIGHSFRDQPVNIAILERLVEAPKSKLIVIDPEAESAVQNLQAPSKEIEQRIIRIPQSFENDARLFRRIKIAIKSSSYNDFRRRARRFFEKAQPKTAQHH